MINDTIVALSTAFVTSAIGVIRMSGDKSFKIISTIFNKPIPTFNNRTTLVGKIINEEEEIDEVVLILYKGPNSFTGEDTVEINCHGGLININKIISLCISKGARQAEHGEFSKKAYYNGKIDLIQAESINDFIMSKNENMSKIALFGMKGTISNKIINIKKKLVEILALIEVNIDYPEYEDIEQMTEGTLKPLINSLLTDMDDVLKNAQIGRIIKDGVSVAIVGRPNAGKSSLLNALIEEDKAIVTEIEGTTRDVVEGKFNYKGITFNLLDTAGIRESNDKIEQIGIEKSKKAINEADFVIILLDGSLNKEEIDNDIVKFYTKKPHIYVINKADMAQIDDSTYIHISAKNNDVEALKEELVKIVGINIDTINDFAMLTNTRQIGLLQKASNSLKSSLNTLNNQLTVDIASIDLRESLDSINDILGEKSKEDLDNEIFSKFCIGK